jgi:Phage tail tube protein
MAAPKTLSFADVVVSLGDGATPEVFTEPCGFTSKSFDCDAATSNAVIPDCDDPEAPAWEIAGVSSKSMVINGDGVLAKDSYEAWRLFWDGGVQQNVRVTLGDLGYWEGPCIITKLGHAVALNTDANKVKLTVNMRNADVMVWTKGTFTPAP